MSVILYPLENSSLVVSTALMWQPLASKSVFKEMSWDRNCTLPDFSLKLKDYMNLRRDSMKERERKVYYTVME